MATSGDEPRISLALQSGVVVSVMGPLLRGLVGQRRTVLLLALGIAKEAAAELISETIHHAERATSELRDLVRGILRASLTRGGLRTAVELLVSDMPVAVDLQVTAPRLQLEIETTTYFVVAEALTNVVKHAQTPLREPASPDCWTGLKQATAPLQSPARPPSAQRCTSRCRSLIPTAIIGLRPRLRFPASPTSQPREVGIIGA